MISKFKFWIFTFLFLISFLQVNQLLCKESNLSEDIKTAVSKGQLDAAMDLCKSLPASPKKFILLADINKKQGKLAAALQNLELAFGSTGFWSRRKILPKVHEMEKSLGVQEPTIWDGVATTLHRWRPTIWAKLNKKALILVKKGCDYLQDLLRCLPDLVFQILALLLWALLLATLFFKRITRGKKLLLFLLWFACAATAFNRAFNAHRKMELALTEITLYSGPGKDYSELGTLKSGQKFRVLQHLNGFLKIQPNNGRRGWIPKQPN